MDKSELNHWRRWTNAEHVLGWARNVAIVMGELMDDLQQHRTREARLLVIDEQRRDKLAEGREARAEVKRLRKALELSRKE